MRIFIDFDYTLFDTHAMRAALRDSLADFEVTEEEYDAAEEEVTSEGLYSLEEHMRALAPTGDSQALLLNSLAVLEDTAPFLYDDATDFLDEHAKHEITVLSFGNEEWQHMKIENSGIIHDDVELQPTSAPKVDFVQNWCAENPGADAVFINDRGTEIDAVKAMCPHVRTIWIRREGTPYTEEECTRADEEYTDLSFTI